MTNTTTASAPPTDALAQFFVDLISGLAENVGIPALEATAEADVPALALPVIKQVFELVVGYLLTKVVIQFEDGVVQLVFIGQAAANEMAAVNALNNLQLAHKQGDPNAIETAKQAAIAAWINVLRFGGVASPH